MNKHSLLIGTRLAKCYKTGTHYTSCRTPDTPLGATLRSPAAPIGLVSVGLRCSQQGMYATLQRDGIIEYEHTCRSYNTGNIGYSANNIPVLVVTRRRRRQRRQWQWRCHVLHIIAQHIGGCRTRDRVWAERDLGSLVDPVCTDPSPEGGVHLEEGLCNEICQFSEAGRNGHSPKTRMWMTTEQTARELSLEVHQHGRSMAAEQQQLWTVDMRGSGRGARARMSTHRGASKRKL